MAEIKLTLDNFKQEVLEAKKPVLVDFWATWCGPCMMMGPILAELAEEHDEFIVGKVNVDEEPQLASAFGIMSIPTLILFKNGQPMKSLVGLRPKSDILKIFE